MGKKKPGAGQARKTKNVAVENDVHQRFADYCERRAQAQSAIASRLLVWFLERPKPMRDWISEPEEVVGSEAKAVYCEMLKQMASEVCAEVGNSTRHRERGNMVVG